MVGADSFDGGNSKLVERLFEASNASVSLRTTVNAVVARDDGTFEIHSQTEKELGFVQTRIDNVDAVILAAPYRFLNLTLPSQIGRQPELQPREFTHWYVTVVKARGLSEDYFGSNVSSYTNLLTTENSTAPFNVIQQVTDPTSSGESCYWKLFSNSNISEHLEDIFVGAAVDDVIVQHWPYTFPLLRPTQSAREPNETAFQPVTLMEGIVYINGMESLASAMETSIIGGRNAAQILRAGALFKKK